jgi:aquaporin Z
MTDRLRIVHAPFRLEAREARSELRSFRDLVDFAAGETALYVRFSRGPEHDRFATSEDYESGLPLPGISVNPLTPPQWWSDRSPSEWVARQLCTYAHLENDGLRAWLVRGRELAERGPDNEPLLVDWYPVAMIAAAVITEARRLRPAEQQAEQQPPWQEQKPSDPESANDIRHRRDEPNLVRCLVAETLGTFALTLVAAGTVMAGVLSHGEVDHVAKAIAPGLIVMALIYAFGDVSGAHFNPAVTLAFAFRRDFRWTRVPGYWFAQLAGATAAGLFLLSTLGRVEHLGRSETTLSVSRTFMLEAVLTAILVLVILNTASRHSLIGTDAALAVGATIALCGLFAATLSGASMNPARSLGPAIIDGHAGNVWIYVVGPALGAIAAVAISFVLHPHRDAEERVAAEGEANTPDKRKGGRP